jgi:hypothetical protein
MMRIMAIDRFGVLAVMGRPVLSYGEIVRMRYAENIVKAYQARSQAENWAQWKSDNLALARVLDEAERLYNGE